MILMEMKMKKMIKISSSTKIKCKKMKVRH